MSHSNLNLNFEVIPDNEKNILINSLEELIKLKNIKLNNPLINYVINNMFTSSINYNDYDYEFLDKNDNSDNDDSDKDDNDDTKITLKSKRPDTPILSKKKLETLNNNLELIKERNSISSNEADIDTNSDEHNSICSIDETIDETKDLKIKHDSDSNSDDDDSNLDDDDSNSGFSRSRLDT